MAVVRCSSSSVSDGGILVDVDAGEEDVFEKDIPMAAMGTEAGPLRVDNAMMVTVTG